MPRGCARTAITIKVKGQRRLQSENTQTETTMQKACAKTAIFTISISRRSREKPVLHAPSQPDPRSDPVSMAHLGSNRSQDHPSIKLLSNQFLSN